MKPLFVDTHAHLYFDRFDDDRAEAIARAVEQGVEHIFLPNLDSSTIGAMYEVCAAHPNNCHAMMGVHPCSINFEYEKELELAKKELYHPKCQFYAVGEIGLDFYWDTTYKKEQILALETQIKWAKELNLPIVLHCRQSFDKTVEVVQSLNDENLGGIFHCFGGSWEDAQKVMALGGFYMGIGGNVTYKKSPLKETLKKVPLEYLVLETDSPFLAPAPHRFNKGNNRNESAYIPLVAQKIADIMGVSVVSVAKKTTQNAFNVFKCAVNA